MTIVLDGSALAPGEALLANVAEIQADPVATFPSTEVTMTNAGEGGVDYFVFRLPASAAGTTISILPDVLRLKIGEGGLFLQETAIVSLAVYQYYKWTGFPATQGTFELRVTGDTRPDEVLGADPRNSLGGTINWAQLTVPQMITDGSGTPGGRDYQDTMVLVATVARLSVPGVNSPDAGRFLIATGPVAGQRDDAWGNWINTVSNGIPDPDTDPDPSLVDSPELLAEYLLEVGGDTAEIVEVATEVADRGVKAVAEANDLHLDELPDDPPEMFQRVAGMADEGDDIFQMDVQVTAAANRTATWAKGAEVAGNVFSGLDAAFTAYQTYKTTGNLGQAAADGSIKFVSAIMSGKVGALAASGAALGVSVAGGSLLAAVGIPVVTGLAVAYGADYLFKWGANAAGFYSYKPDDPLFSPAEGFLPPMPAATSGDPAPHIDLALGSHPTPAWTYDLTTHEFTWLDPELEADYAKTLTAMGLSADPVGLTLFGDQLLSTSEDYLVGAGGADVIRGLTGDDVISGGAGNDTMTGGTGNDAIAGGAGDDRAAYLAASSDFEWWSLPSGNWRVKDLRDGRPDGTDMLADVERLMFTDTEIRLSGLTHAEQITDAFKNILRLKQPAGADLAFLDGLIASVTSGAKTLASAVADIVQRADHTSGVAVMSYQFFLGHTIGKSGFDYLVSPTGPNATNLNSAFYQSFSTENRYINFSVNLGKYGEGAPAFQAAYGGLTLFQATKAAYEKIFGGVVDDAKINSILFTDVGGMTRAEYFAAYGGDGLSGIGTKAAVVGWLLTEAAKADVGMFALSSNAFLADMADGAETRIDIVARYGRPAFVFPSQSDIAAPTLVSSVPADNAAAVAVGANLTLTFNEAVKAGLGAIEIRRSSDGALFASLSVANTAQVSFSGSTVTLNPAADLAAGTGYYVTLASGVVTDLAGNAYAGIASATALNFTTAAAADATAPTLTSSTPADNATGVAVGANLVLTFSEAVQAGTGSIEIRRSSDGLLASSLSVTSGAQVSFSGSTVTLDPVADLAASTGYYVTLASGVIRDLAGNAYAGIGSATVLNFTTAAPADSTAPTLVSSNPADDATAHAVNANLTLNFSEAVKAGTGLISIRRASDGIAVYSVSSTAGSISFNGSTMTIDPSSDLTPGTAFYVTVAPGAVTDLAGNGYAGISSATTLNFTTVADDYPASPSTTGVVADGGSLTGTIGGSGDVDWIQFSMIAGRSYAVNVEGSATAMGTLADPFTRILDGFGTVLHTLDNGGVGLNSRLTFTATSTNIHYIAVSAAGGTATGSYRVSMAQADDYPNSHTDTSTQMITINIGGSAGAEVDSPGDRDVFRVNLVAGQTYTFKAQGATIGGAPPVDPYLWLYNSTGTFENTASELAENDDSGGGFDSRIVHTATYTGVHYLQVGGWDVSVGGYVLSAQSGNVAAPLDEGADAPLIGLAEFDPLAA